MIKQNQGQECLHVTLGFVQVWLDGITISSLNTVNQNQD